MSSNNQTPAPTVYQQQHEDEISLVDIVKVLLRRKKLIFGITALVVCIGLLYTFSQKPVYQAEILVLPPLVENIQPLNILHENFVNSLSVFKSFIKTVESRKLKKEFFERFNISKTIINKSESTLTEREINDIFEVFLNTIKVSKDQKSGATRITLEGSHKEELEKWLGNLVEAASQETVNLLISNRQINMDLKSENLKIEISSKRTVYKKRRKDELYRLKEAVQIAEKLGLHEYNSASKILPNKNNLSIYMKGTKLYMQGTKILEAEITALQSRQSDDVYIKGLRDLQESLDRIKSIKFDKNKLRAVIVDKKATGTVKQIRPNKKLILILSFILGGMLGIFGVFILEFIGNFKKQVNNESDFDNA